MTARLNNRVLELERCSEPAGRGVTIFQHFGQTEDEAISAYETEHGSIGGRTVYVLSWRAPQEVPCN